jgi:hypothetical protein
MRRLFSVCFALSLSALSAGRAFPGTSPGIDITTLFGERPNAREVCQTVMENPDACGDLPVVRGSTVNALLAIENAHGEFYRIGPAGVTPETALEGTHTEEERQQVVAIVTEIVQALKEKGFSDGSFMVLSSSTHATKGTTAAHEYGHYLFETEYQQIRAEYLPVRGHPIMNEALIAESIRRCDSGITISSGGPGENFRVEDPEKIAREVRRDRLHYLQYYGDPSEEFAAGFATLAFVKDHPDATLKTFMEYHQDGVVPQGALTGPWCQYPWFPFLIGVWAQYTGSGA